MNKHTIKGALIWLVVALISIVPLAAGFVAGVVSMLSVIIWHGLRLGFERGYNLLREGRHG